jgi:hypothetical protein
MSIIGKFELLIRTEHELDLAHITRVSRFEGCDLTNSTASFKPGQNDGPTLLASF